MKYLTFFVSLAAITHSQGATINIFNTGVSPANTLLAGGSSDSHWQVVSGPGVVAAAPAIVVTNQSPFGVYAQDSSSRWIWINAAGAGGTGTPFVFSQTFDLTGLDRSTAVINASWGVDDVGFVRLNGSTSGIGSGALSLTPVVESNFRTLNDFTLDSGFLPGLNTLEFVTTDNANPGGLNFTIRTSSADAIPEPSSALLLGLGALGLLTRRR